MARGWLCCSAPARRLGSAARGSLGRRGVSVPAEPCPQRPPCVGHVPFQRVESGRLCSVRPLADGSHQRPPVNGALPKVVQSFQVAEVVLEPASAAVLPSAGHRLPAPASPYKIIHIFVLFCVLPCSLLRAPVFLARSSRRWSRHRASSGTGLGSASPAKPRRRRRRFSDPLLPLPAAPGLETL